MKLFKSLAILGLGQAMPTSSGSGGLCEADSEPECTGTLCNWNGSACSVTGRFSSNNLAIQAKMDKVSHIPARIYENVSKLFGRNVTLFGQNVHIIISMTQKYSEFVRRSKRP